MIAYSSITHLLLLLQTIGCYAAKGGNFVEPADDNSGHSTSRHQPNPQILSHDQIFRAQVGETLVLPCQVAALGNYVLMWKQQNRVLTAGTLVVRKDYRMRLKDDFSLELTQLKPDDQGTYTCEIDVMGKPISIKHKIEVMVPPAVQSKPREGLITTRKGQDVTLRCSGRGNPNPRITWSKKTGLLPSGHKTQEGLSLELQNVRRQDAGTYTCTANNGVGEEASAEIQVEIKYPPEIEIEQNWYQREAEDVEVELICVVHAKPEGEVSWYRRQKKLHETDRLLFQTKGSRQTLYIRKVNPTDFGNYSCRAENALGEARTFTELSGRPRPPRFTSEVIGYKPDSYNITWITDTYKPITEYKILYRRSDGLPITQWEHIEENTGSWETVFIPVTSPHNSHSHSHSPTSPSFSAQATYTLKNLRSGAVYDIVAKAKNKFGWSQLSKVFNFFNKGVDYSTQQLSDRSDKQQDYQQQQQQSVSQQKQQKLGLMDDQSVVGSKDHSSPSDFSLNAGHPFSASAASSLKRTTSNPLTLVLGLVLMIMQISISSSSHNIPLLPTRTYVQRG